MYYVVVFEKNACFYGLLTVQLTQSLVYKVQCGVCYGVMRYAHLVGEVMLTLVEYL